MVTGIPSVAVVGNHDHWNNARMVDGALTARGITVLRNRAIPLERGRSRIWVSGIDDALAGAADLGNALRPLPSSETTILLAHEPDFADYAAGFAVDLQLSGHSHGGQVRVPGIGALMLPAMAEKCPVGLNRVGASPVYTNRGLGVIKRRFVSTALPRLRSSPCPRHHRFDAALLLSLHSNLQPVRFDSFPVFGKAGFLGRTFDGSEL
jgi:predicted MPP superfamily phosphohydrolase